MYAEAFVGEFVRERNAHAIVGYSQSAPVSTAYSNCSRCSLHLNLAPLLHNQIRLSNQIR